ncbi:phosphoribosyl-ATP pyrophosphatase [Clostridium acetireducens DSM 10703]|jgi:phosphoribosyl-ATP pyrophosphohydrolase|uniref:Phosphoribosyl-ATP pyrophosphatase n=1 Tax=Clostridium acetireducens DSM 10703 TaxID=1121290 RepID=A0A1E8EXX0_9CLOT|nr:phosphoribosyl-ATP diphosphatase [Clostridium acetireducens]OFI05364.1 phosphoribosyl-ATP pyrophosphatase [Clostridium acetireducens DSM 10703]
MNSKYVIEKLYNTILERKLNRIEGSYTGYLFNEGIDKILKKVGEESSEVIIASKNDNKEEIVYEVCDLIYHLLVLMADRNVDINDILIELEKRSEKICNKKREKKVNKLS